MWKLLGLLVLCGLLSRSEGKVPGIRSVFSNREVNRALSTVMKENDLLPRHLKGIALADIKLGGLFGLLGNIAGLKVSNAQLTGTTVSFLQDKVNITSFIHMDITGDALLTTKSVITISLDMTLKLIYGIDNFSEGFFDVIFHECGCTFGAIDINLLGGLLPLSAITTIQKSIITDINHQVCPMLKVVFDVIKVVLLDTINVVLPLGTYGNAKVQISSLPTIQEAYIGVDVYVDLLVAGAIISIPETAISISVPPVLNYKQCQAIHPGLLNIILSVISPKQPRELSCTPDAYSKADELRNATLALIPGGGSASISTSILYFNISLLEDPEIVFSATGANVSACVQIEAFVKNADGSVLSVVVVNSSLTLPASISVVSSKLKIALSISENVLALVSSGVGITDVSSLVPHCNNLLGEIFLPLLNVPLDTAIQLPSLLDTVLDNAFVQVIEGALLLYI